MKQLSLFPSEEKVHSGILHAGKRKNARPLSHKRPLHLVLKAKRRILYPIRAAIYEEIRRKAEHFGITAYGLAVNFDHIHFIFRIPSHELYKGFVRALTGVLARKLGIRLWRLLPFTRVMNWGKDFRNGLEYLRKNREEASGARPYEPRRDWYKKWRDATQTLLAA